MFGKQVTPRSWSSNGNFSHSVTELDKSVTEVRQVHV